MSSHMLVFEHSSPDVASFSFPCDEAGRIAEGSLAPLALQNVTHLLLKDDPDSVALGVPLAFRGFRSPVVVAIPEPETEEGSVLAAEIYADALKPLSGSR